MTKRKGKTKEEKTFTRRTSSIFYSQKRRAKEYESDLDYSLEELRIFVRSALGRPCPYCCLKLTAYNLSLDHEQPTSRGGAHALHNLAVLCERCNQIKGNMTAEEFSLLMQIARDMPEAPRRSLLARLRAGGRFISSKAA